MTPDKYKRHELITVKKTNAKRKLLFLSASLVVGALVLQNNLEEERADEYIETKTTVETCEYTCTGELNWRIVDTTRHCPNPACKPREDPTRINDRRINDRPKKLYRTEKEAIWAAIYYGEKHNNGNSVYKCPKGYGFHLSTTYPHSVGGGSRPRGELINLKKKDIGPSVCHKHK